MDWEQRVEQTSEIAEAVAFRCLETNHEFSKRLRSSAPALLHQTATCPTHHCAAVRVETRAESARRAG